MDTGLTPFGAILVKNKSPSPFRPFGQGIFYIGFEPIYYQFITKAEIPIVLVFLLISFKDQQKLNLFNLVCNLIIEMLK